jgi:hypothetical protein
VTKLRRLTPAIELAKQLFTSALTAAILAAAPTTSAGSNETAESRSALQSNQSTNLNSGATNCSRQQEVKFYDQNGTLHATNLKADKDMVEDLIDIFEVIRKQHFPIDWDGTGNSGWKMSGRVIDLNPKWCGKVGANAIASQKSSRRIRSVL